MVYCGKPSKGCQMCRTRRIRCDLTKPTCNQCAKSRRQCPGYRNDFDLILRNETEATERRAQKVIRKAAAQKMSKAGQQPSSSASGEASSSTLKDGAKSPVDMSIIPALQMATESQASCHFVSNFVLVPRQGGTRGFLDYLIPLLKTEPSNSPLQHAFDACSLASLSGRTNSKNGANLSDKAFAEYTKALKVTGAALKDPKIATSDGVLAAVLLLGMFENMAAKQIGSFAWGSHVEGALQIAKARGRKQLETQIGLLLFIAVRTQLVIHSLSTGKPPIMGSEWWINDAMNDMVATQCQRLNLKACELRAELTRLMTTVTWTPESVELMLALMRRGQSLDQEIVSWMRSAPEHWQYKTLCWEDHVPNGNYAKAEVFPGRVDVYNDFWIASVWNMARTTRLILASLTVRCAAWVCSPVDYRTTPEYAAATRICVDMITDIIASVPYHLGWHAKRKHLFENHQLSGFACGEDDSMKGLAGYFLTWPLTCVMGQDYATDAQRAWVRGRLKYIGDELGVKYAHILSELQLRIPSMLIRRDGLMAVPHPTASNFVKLLATGSAPPADGQFVNPLQQLDLLTKTVGTPGQSRQEMARKLHGTL